MLRHVLCCHKEECSFPECKVSKILLNHFHRCRLQHCRLCTNLRNALQKSPPASPAKSSRPPLFPNHDRHTPCTPRSPSQASYQRLVEICRQQEDKIKKLGAVNKVLLQELLQRDNARAECSNNVAATQAKAPAIATTAGAGERTSDEGERKSSQQQQEEQQQQQQQSADGNKDFTFPIGETKRALAINIVPSTSNGSTSSSSQGYKRAGSDQGTSLPMKKRFRPLVRIDA